MNDRFVENTALQHEVLAEQTEKSFRKDEKAWTDDDWARDEAERERTHKHMLGEIREAQTDEELAFQREAMIQKP